MACSCSFSQGGFQIASKNSFIAWLLVLQSFRLRVKAQMCSVTKAWAETTFTFSTEKVKKSRRWGGGWDKDEGQNQCDQIWRNFPILAIFKSLRLLREGLFSVGQKFETALVNILCHLGIFLFCKWPEINKYSCHLVTPGILQTVRLDLAKFRKLSKILLVSGHRCLVEKNVPIALFLPSRWQMCWESRDRVHKLFKT